MHSSIIAMTKKKRKFLLYYTDLILMLYAVKIYAYVKSENLQLIEK